MVIIIIITSQTSLDRFCFLDLTSNEREPIIATDRFARTRADKLKGYVFCGWDEDTGCNKTKNIFILFHGEKIHLMVEVKAFLGGIRCTIKIYKPVLLLETRHYKVNTEREV